MSSNYEAALSAYIIYDNYIIHSYDDYKLFDLYTWMPDGKYAGAILTDVTRRKVQRKEFHDFQLFDDLYFITKDLKYCICNLYFLRPHINKSSMEDGTFLKNPFDTRYMMYVNISYQLIYNYYDKIGDLLDCFFDTGLKDKVYFSRVINNFPAEYRNNSAFVWFETILNDEVKELSTIRDEIVHFIHLETKNFYEVMNARLDSLKLQEIESMKDNYPEKLHSILNNCLQAFIMSVKLIDHLPDKIMTTTTT